MPLVREYIADANVAGPNETRQARPADTGEVGLAAEKLGNAVMNLGETLHHRDAQAEISRLTASMSKAHADYTNGLDNTLQNADPNDNTISEKFMKSYDDNMDKIGQSVQTPEGQKYFNQMNAHMRDHFQVKSMQGQSVIAGQGAVNDYNSMLSNFSSSLEKDPSAFGQVKDMHDMMLQSYKGKIPQAKIDQLTREGHSELAKSMVRGWNDLDAPEFAKSMLEKGQLDKEVNGDVKYQLIKESERAIEGKKTEAKRAQTAADQELANAQEKIKDSFLNKAYNNDLSPQEVLKNPTLDATQKEHMLGIIKKNSTERIETNPSTFISLFDKIHLPDGDKNKITNEDDLNQYVGRGLTIPALQQLRTELRGRKTEQGKFESDLQKNFMDRIVKDKLTKTNPMIGAKDPEGDESYQKYMAWFYPEFQKQKAAGKSVSALLTPGSPDYMGNNIGAFVRTPEQIMKSMYSPSPNPSAPGSATTPNAAAPNKEPLRKVSADEISQYSKKHNMTADEAKSFLKGQGYGVD